MKLDITATTNTPLIYELDYTRKYKLIGNNKIYQNRGRSVFINSDNVCLNLEKYHGFYIKGRKGLALKAGNSSVVSAMDNCNISVGTDSSVSTGHFSHVFLQGASCRAEVGNDSILVVNKDSLLKVGNFCTIDVLEATQEHPVLIRAEKETVLITFPACVVYEDGFSVSAYN